MTFNKTAAYGGNITINLPSGTNFAGVVNQKVPEERIITYVGGQSSGAGHTYSHTFTFPASDLAMHGRELTFINTTSFSDVSITVNTTSFTLLAGRLTRVFLNGNNNIVAMPRFTTVGTGTDGSATPSQFIVFGQAVATATATYMYNPVADTWTTKATRPASSLDCIGGDVTTGPAADALTAPHQTLHIDGSSMWEFLSSNSYSSKTGPGSSLSHDACVGVVDGSTKCIFVSTGTVSSAMQVKRYSTAANTWSTSNQPGWLNHDVGIAVATTVQAGTASMFLMFGTSSISTKAIAKASGPSPLFWSVFPNPPTGNDFASASISQHSYSIYVFGGSNSPNQIAFGTNKLRINVSNNSFAWKTGMSAPNVIFGQAAFTHSTSGKIYLMAGSNASTGSFQQHQYYDVNNESYTSVSSRAWTNYGGYRHNAKARINWMS